MSSSVRRGENPVRELLELQPSSIQADPGKYLNWLDHLQNALSSAPEPHVVAIARPIRQSLELLWKARNAPKEEFQDAVNATKTWLAEAQALAFYAFIEEFRKLTEQIIAQVKKLKKNSPMRKKGEKLEAAYREMYGVLSGTYNDMLDGKEETLEKFPEAFGKAQKMMEDLKPLADETP